MLEKRSKKSTASKLRHLVWIQTKVSVSDNEGGYKTSWKNTTKTYASVDPIKSTQMFEYKSLHVDATHFVTMRGKIALTEKNRILFGTRILEILTIDNIQERGIEKFCVCNEKR